jgi:chaperonin GroES
MLGLLKDQIAISGIGDPDKTKSGLYIPDVARERTDQGVVRYIGPDVKDIQVGDYVVFSGWTGTALHIEGEGLIILMPEDQVVCKVHQMNTPISGLYHMSKDGGFFPATYESSMDMVREQYYDLPRRLNLKNRKE